MSKKAVYSNKGLQVYITKEDFEELLDRTVLEVPVYIGKVQSEGAWIVVKTFSKANIVLKETLQLEQQAVAQVRQASQSGFAKHVQIIQNSHKE